MRAGGATALPRFGEGVGAGWPMDRTMSQLALRYSHPESALNQNSYESRLFFRGRPGPEARAANSLA